MPIARAISHELIPFFALLTIHIATNHLSRPSALSSKIVPTRTENCFLQFKQFQMRRVFTRETLSDWQCGQVAIPLLHLRLTAYSNTRSGWEKNSIACFRV